MQTVETITRDSSLVMPDGIGARLRSIRRACGLQQTALATLMGVVQQSVSAWEREHTYMTLPMLWTFCRVTGVSADKVLGLNEISVGLDNVRAVLAEVGL